MLFKVPMGLSPGEHQDSVREHRAEEDMLLGLVMFWFLCHHCNGDYYSRAGQVIKRLIGYLKGESDSELRTMKPARHGSLVP